MSMPGAEGAGDRPLEAGVVVAEDGPGAESR